MRLSKDDILAAADTRTEEVEVPEWGGTVLVRGLTGLERDDYEMSLMVERGGRLVMDTANTRAKLAVRCCIDDDGRRIFGDGDANELGRKSGRALDRVFEAATRLSGLRAEDAEKAAENFGVAPNGTSSNSALPVTSG